MLSARPNCVPYLQGLRPARWLVVFRTEEGLSEPVGRGIPEALWDCRGQFLSELPEVDDVETNRRHASRRPSPNGASLMTLISS